MLKQIELALENCEEIIIPAEDIEWLNIRDIEEFWNYSHGDIYKGKEAKYFMVSIKNTANKIENYPSLTQEEQTQLPFDRLTQHNDIAQVHFKYNDSCKDEFFFFDWCDDDDDRYSNSYQETTRYEDSLVIQIEKK